MTTDNCTSATLFPIEFIFVQNHRVVKMLSAKKCNAETFGWMLLFPLFLLFIFMLFDIVAFHLLSHRGELSFAISCRCREQTIT